MDYFDISLAYINMPRTNFHSTYPWRAVFGKKMFDGRRRKDRRCTDARAWLRRANKSTAKSQAVDLSI